MSLPPLGPLRIGQFKDEYRFLSNFWPCTVEFAGMYYASVEHAYQAAKHVEDGRRRAIRSCLSAGEAKRLARTWPISTPNWDDHRLVVMEGLLRQKFGLQAQHQRDLRTKLVATGTVELVEGNVWNDRFWGVALPSGQGENNLGKLLMKIREEARR